MSFNLKTTVNNKIKVVDIDLYPAKIETEILENSNTVSQTNQETKDVFSKIQFDYNNEDDLEKIFTSKTNRRFDIGFVLDTSESMLQKQYDDSLTKWDMVKLKITNSLKKIISLNNNNYNLDIRVGLTTVAGEIDYENNKIQDSIQILTDKSINENMLEFINQLDELECKNLPNDAVVSGLIESIDFFKFRENNDKYIILYTDHYIGGSLDYREDPIILSQLYDKFFEKNIKFIVINVQGAVENKLSYIEERTCSKIHFRFDKSELNTLSVLPFGQKLPNNWINKFNENDIEFQKPTSFWLSDNGYPSYLRIISYPNLPRMEQAIIFQVDYDPRDLSNHYYIEAANLYVFSMNSDAIFNRFIFQTNYNQYQSSLYHVPKFYNMNYETINVKETMSMKVTATINSLK